MVMLMNLLANAFTEMSDKTLFLKKEVEQMLKCDICYFDMPSSKEYSLGESGFDHENGYYHIGVKMIDGNGIRTTIDEVEEILVHEILHARQFALGFATVCADNRALAEIEQRLSAEDTPHTLVGIRNLGSVIGHIELIPIMTRLGYSIEKHLGEKLSRVLASKLEILMIVNGNGKMLDYDYDILCADLLLQLVEIYLFFPDNVKKQLEELHPFIGEKLRLISRKLNTGVVRDIITEYLQFTEFADTDTHYNNCARLLNFTDLSGKKLFKIVYKKSSRIL